MIFSIIFHPKLSCSVFVYIYTAHWRDHECQHLLWHTEAEHDPLPSETGPQGSIPTWKWPQTHLQDDHCLAKEAECKVNLWGILKRKMEERKVSNIHQLRDVIMEEWKMTPVATCEALVNSMPKRVKAVLENNGGHTKYWHIGPNLDIFT